MPATITAIIPPSAAPGAEISITGAGFVAGVSVFFSGLLRTVQVSPIVASDTALTVIVPDAFDGAAGRLQITVASEEVESNSVDFLLQESIAVESIPLLCTIGALKQTLGLGPEDTSDDIKLARLITIASGQITGWCENTFSIEEVLNEPHDGDGTALLQLNRSPILSVSAISIDGLSVPASEARVYKQFIKFDDTGEYSPRLRSTSRIFPAGCQNVLVSYSAGYARIPGDISLACVLQVIWLQNTLSKLGLVSETNQVAQATTMYSQIGLAPEVRRICNRYRPQRMAIV